MNFAAGRKIYFQSSQDSLCIVWMNFARVASVYLHKSFIHMFASVLCKLFWQTLQEDNMNKIVTVVGATASGKSQVGIEIAKKFNGEIISCDSMQVYRHMNIGTPSSILLKSCLIWSLLSCAPAFIADLQAFWANLSLIKSAFFNATADCLSLNNECRRIRGKSRLRYQRYN